MESIIFKTLLHSLWQGVFLAVLTALIVLFTTKSNAKLRYNLFVGSLLLFVLAAGATFLVELNSFNSTVSAQSTTLTNSKEVVTNIDPIITNAVVNPKVLDNIMGYLSRYSSSIVLVWFLIICAKSIRFMVDIRTLFQIRSTKVFHAGALLEGKVSSLAAKYGIKQSVKILQSGMIQVPMVLGHFKPLILVPLGLINGLSMEEVDAILSHELAHIKRKDYMINLLQSVVEILFFFNPAVLWVSNMIKTERENCCDDMAISGARTKIDYIKALVSCQEFASQVPAYAMAVTGGKKHLVNRVQRLISSKNQSLNKVEKAIVGIVLISSLVISSAFSDKSALKQVVNTVKVNSAAITDTVKNDVTHTIDKKAAKEDLKQDTTSKKKIEQRIKELQLKEIALAKERAELQARVAESDGAISNSRGQAIYNQLIREGVLKPGVDATIKLNNEELIVNGVKQSNAVFKVYQEKYKTYGFQSYNYRLRTDGNEENSSEAQIKKSLKANEDVKKAIQAEIQAKRQESVTIEHEVNVQVNANQNIAVDAKVNAIVNAERAQATAQRAQVQAAANAKRAQARAADEAKGLRALALADSQRAKIQSEVNIMRAEQAAENGRIQAEKARRQAEAARIQAEKERVDAKKGNLMTNDLMADGLIKNKNNYTYKLSKDGLVIDGEDQPDAVYKKYAKKYLKSLGQTITTSVSVN